VEREVFQRDVPVGLLAGLGRPAFHGASLVRPVFETCTFGASRVEMEHGLHQASRNSAQHSPDTYAPLLPWVAPLLL